MPCDFLTAGRSEGCLDVTGGLQAIYFIDYEDVPVSNVAYDATNTDVIETLNPTPSTVSAYKFELDADACTFEQTVNKDKNNGTLFWEQALNVTLKKQDLATHKQVKLLGYGRPHIIVQDKNSNFFYMGLEWGCHLTGGSIVSGGAMGDLSGYNLIFTANERIPANFLEAIDEAGLATAGLSVVS